MVRCDAPGVCQSGRHREKDRAQYTLFHPAKTALAFQGSRHRRFLAARFEAAVYERAKRFKAGEVQNGTPAINTLNIENIKLAR